MTNDVRDHHYSRHRRSNKEWWNWYSVLSLRPDIGKCADSDIGFVYRSNAKLNLGALEVLVRGPRHYVYND
jgi:hypothetical protein